MHMHVINPLFLETEVDLIISEWLIFFKEYNSPDFKF